MHTRNLRPGLIQDTAAQYSEWDIRMAWDDVLSGTTFEREVGDAFHSFAFQAFLKRLKEIFESRKESKAPNV